MQRVYLLSFHDQGLLSANSSYTHFAEITTILTFCKRFLTSFCLTDFRREVVQIKAFKDVHKSSSVLPWTSTCPALSSSCWPGSPGWGPYCRIVAPGWGVAGLGRVRAWTPCKASPPGPANCIAPPWVIATAQTQNNETVYLQFPKTLAITTDKSFINLGNICAVSNVLLFRKKGLMNNKTLHFKGNNLNSHVMPHNVITIWAMNSDVLYCPELVW